MAASLFFGENMERFYIETIIGVILAIGASVACLLVAWEAFKEIWWGK